MTGYGSLTPIFDQSGRRRDRAQLLGDHHSSDETICKFHDRMPAILVPDNWPMWLGEVSARSQELKDLVLRPYFAEKAKVWPIGRAGCCCTMAGVDGFSGKPASNFIFSELAPYSIEGIWPRLTLHEFGQRYNFSLTAYISADTCRGRRVADVTTAIEPSER
jgi:hypothetical protein